MKRVVVSGAHGFIGMNLMKRLADYPDVSAEGYDVQDGEGALLQALAGASIFYHLAGVNRPDDPSEHFAVNAELTSRLMANIAQMTEPPLVVLSSSRQAGLDNPYGQSKRLAEDAVFGLASSTGTSVFVYRLPNVFGKWSRPFYNSVVATFCYLAARGQQLPVEDPTACIDLAYIDDVVESMAAILVGQQPVMEGRFAKVLPVFPATVGELAARIRSYSDARAAGFVPELSDPLTRRLWATYVSHVPSGDLARPAAKKEDGRGYLMELVKSVPFGQIFVSRTKPGVTRGNHYHHTKTEKFCVLAGRAQISLRNISTGEKLQFESAGEEIAVIDIPPGWAHNIMNKGDCDLIALFWASEVFDPARPDTHVAEV